MTSRPVRQRNHNTQRREASTHVEVSAANLHDDAVVNAQYRLRARRRQLVDRLDHGVATPKGPHPQDLPHSVAPHATTEQIRVATSRVSQLGALKVAVVTPTHRLRQAACSA